MLARFVERESEVIRQGLDESKAKSEKMMSEIETWAMRFEETSQNLSSSQLKISYLLSLVKDYQKTIIANEKLHNDQISTQKHIENSYQNMIDYLQEEIKGLNIIIVDEIMPNAEKTLSVALSSAHVKLSSLKNYMRAHSLDPSYIRHSSIQVNQMKKELEEARIDIQEIYNCMCALNVRSAGSVMPSLNATKEIESENLNHTDMISIRPLAISDLKFEVFKRIREFNDEQERNIELIQDLSNLQERMKSLKDNMLDRERS